AWSEPADTNAPAAQDDPAARQAHMQQHLQERLDRMAVRLQITPAQQDAWAAYAGTVQRLAGTKLARPAPEADAASVARFRAELAAERAQRLAQLADATAALQQALDPEQQQALGKLVRHAGRRFHHGGHRSL
ncbi:MAG TPA: Spy/CpxP family protein refolding chaperone, partial [Burkholderiales bacterium]